MQEELASFIFAENLRAEELAHDQGRILHVPQKSRYWERFMSSRCGSLTREDQVIAQMKEGTAGMTRPLPEIVAACLSIVPNNNSDALQQQQQELTPASLLMRSKQGRALLKQQYRSGLRGGNDLDTAASSPVTVVSVVGSPAPICVPASSATSGPSTTVSATTVLRSSPPAATPVPRLLKSARSIVVAPARVPPRHASAQLPLPSPLMKAARTLDNTDSSFFQRAVQCPYIAWNRNSCSVDSIDWVLHVAFMYLADQKGFSRHSNSSISVSQEFFESVQNDQFPVSMNILLQHSNSLLSSYVSSSSSLSSSSLPMEEFKALNLEVRSNLRPLYNSAFSEFRLGRECSLRDALSAVLSGTSSLPLIDSAKWWSLFFENTTTCSICGERSTREVANIADIPALSSLGRRLISDASHSTTYIEQLVQLYDPGFKKSQGNSLYSPLLWDRPSILYHCLCAALALPDCAVPCHAIPCHASHAMLCHPACLCLVVSNDT